MKDETRVKSERIHSGRVINLDVDTVRFPDGSMGELEIVRHPGASAVVPFLSDPAAADPQVLLIKQYRYAADGFLYEIPAGRLNPGEAPADCARRELAEETGCSAAQLTFLTSTYTTPGFSDERIHLFLATGLTRGDARRERDEFMEVTTLPLSRALAMVERGEICDAKTALGLLYAAGFRASLEKEQAAGTKRGR
ncbi:MAG TPA: NUDIX hydrolase [Gemmatimonadaceae bacterium]|nr:NUDIX hydrolase [Gemmatimonadaceae bacterium]